MIPPAADIGDGVPGGFDKGAGRKDLGGIGDIDEMVANPPARVGIGFVGADVESPVDGERVGGDDLTADGLGHFEPQAALARRRRSDDEQKRLAVIIG